MFVKATLKSALLNCLRMFSESSLRKDHQKNNASTTRVFRTMVLLHVLNYVLVFLLLQLQGLFDSELKTWKKKSRDCKTPVMLYIFRTVDALHKPNFFFIWCTVVINSFLISCYFFKLIQSIPWPTNHICSSIISLRPAHQWIWTSFCCL